MAEKTDPELLNLPEVMASGKLEAEKSRLRDLFRKQYPKSYAEQPGTPASTSSATVSPSRPDGWTDARIDIVCDILARTTVHLNDSATRISAVVGRAGQQSIWAFIEEMLPTSIAGMGLNEVTLSTKRRLAEACDADEPTRRKRVELEDLRSLWQKVK